MLVYILWNPSWTSSANPSDSVISWTAVATLDYREEIDEITFWHILAMAFSRWGTS